MNLKSTYLLFSFIFLNISIGISQTNYYVAKTGDDSNNGTDTTTPFLTIQKAADVAEAGDIVIISEGIYRENVKPANSGTETAPITFRAKAGEVVTISGMEEINGWTQHQGNIYKVQVPFNLGDDNMVMYDSRFCDWARFPNNEDGNLFTLDALDNSGGSLSNLTGNIPNFDWSNGGVLWYLGNSRWTSWREKITGASSGEITFNGPGGWEGNNHNPANGGKYFLMGIEEALDYPYEFYFKSPIQTLFLYTPDGQAPADGAVQMKKRNIGFELWGKNYIIVDGIDHYGCSIEIKGSSTGNIIKNLDVFWGNHTWGVDGAAVVNKQSVLLEGSNNLIERCEVAWGATSGIWIKGTGNEVRDCIVHDFNYIASYAAPIMMRQGNHSKIIQNTLFNGGRDVIQAFNTNMEIAYNDVYKSNLINDDCGPIYTCCGTFDSEIHHNFFHDADSPGANKFKATGIYLDNSAQNYDVHHNVVYNMEWTGIQMNWDNWNYNIYNNTIWNVSETFGRWANGYTMSNLKVFNNLSNEDTWIGTDISNNLKLDDSPFADFDEDNFQLQSGSAAIDYGTTIPGITIDYNGAAPDAGAFESGSDPWVPGATWLQDSTVDIDELKVAEVLLEIFPNPTTDFIRFQLEDTEPYELFIFDNTGKEVMRRDAVVANEEINVSAIQTGVYFVYLRKGNTLRIGKIMVLK
ncbi:MAG: T9SS type A sorting domain-containing protein [Bacteroidota bacterium]